jgi:hypothetical protein
VKRAIDLDDAAAATMGRLDGWRADGFTVEGPTWRESVTWPQRITADREIVVDPDSVGARLRRGTKEGSIVLYVHPGAPSTTSSSTSPDQYSRSAQPPGDPLTIELFAVLLDRWRAFFGGTMSPMPKHAGTLVPSACIQRARKARVVLGGRVSGARRRRRILPLL